MARRTAYPDTTFAHAFGIHRRPADDWFDPKLHTDTDLFIDPFLMFEETAEPWSSIHPRLIEFFNTAMTHVAAANRDRNSAAWQRAATMFSFPEPPQFCLGYSRHSIFGSGARRGLGNAMLELAQSAIQSGIRNIDDFGELMIFGEHFGADRISDMVCNITKDVFVGYTSKVARRHRLDTTPVQIAHHSFDFDRSRWRSRRIALPLNPCWEPAPGVLLVPERFLAQLPRMEDGAFWDWVYNNFNEQLRQELGFEVTSRLNRTEIIGLARRRPTLVQRYGIQYAERYRADPPRPYDFENDPALKQADIQAGQAFADFALGLLQPPSDAEALCAFVHDLLTQFKELVEQRGIWKSFWTDGRPRHEADSQRLFHASAWQVCQRMDVDLTPEADAGQGPVDFKFSRGARQRAVVEVKHAGSSHFWDNLDQQPPAYMRAESAPCGYFLVIQHLDAHCADEFTTKVNQLVSAVAKREGKDYQAVFIDVRDQPSASRRRRQPGSAPGEGTAV